MPYLLVRAVETADAEVHDACFQVAPVARQRGRASHGAAHHLVRENRRAARARVPLHVGRFAFLRRSAATRFRRVRGENCISLGDL